MTTTILWLYPFGQGMVVGIFGIATGSMGVSYSKILDQVLFASALKKVMIMVIYSSFFEFFSHFLGLGHNFFFFLHFFLDRCCRWNVH